MTAEIKIVFMRHARSRADDEQVHEGRYDSPLTDVGRRQVQKRVDYFVRENFKFDLIVASPLVRAHETAQIVARTLSVPLETDPDWMEVDNGLLKQLPYAEAEQRYPRPAFRNPYEPMAHTGESEWELHLRAGRAVEKMIRRGVGSYLVVAHGGILNATLRMMMNAPLPINAQGTWFHFADTGFARTFYRPQKGEWHLVELRGEN